MSFRRALHYTRIAQFAGRLVVRPLSETRVPVPASLRHEGFKNIIDLLSRPETGLAAAPEFGEGDELVVLPRDEHNADLFALAETLPTDAIERILKASNVRRLTHLGRTLATRGATRNSRVLSHSGLLDTR